MNDEPQVCARVTRRFDVPPERVFDAWLDPETVRNWFGPGLGEMTRVEVDPRVGGSFSFVQRRDGEDIDHIGEYLEVDRPRRLVFTWGIAGESSPDDSRVALDFVPLPNGSEVTLTHEMHPDWADYVDRCEASWAKMLDAMAGTI